MTQTFSATPSANACTGTRRERSATWQMVASMVCVVLLAAGSTVAAAQTSTPASQKPAKPQTAKPQTAPKTQPQPVAQTAAPQVQPIEKWHNFASKTGKPKHLRDDNLVFMRAPKAANGRPISIYVNGEYHTTLLPGGYKSARVCAGKNSVGMAYVGSIDKVEAYKNNPQYWFNMPKDSDKTLYVAIVKSPQGHPMLQAIKPDAAIELLKTLKEQTHALSRLTSKCAA